MGMFLRLNYKDRFKFKIDEKIEFLEKATGMPIEMTTLSRQWIDWKAGHIASSEMRSAIDGFLFELHCNDNEIEI